MDRRSLLIGLSSTGVTGLTAAPALALPPPDMRATVAIVAAQGIDTSNSEPRYGFCTGFFTSRQGYLVTTRHAMTSLGATVEPASVQWKVFLSKFSDDYLPASIVYELPHVDLLVLAVKGASGVSTMRPAKFWRGALDDIAEGVTPVFTSGYAVDEDYKTEQGRIASKSGSTNTALHAWTTSQFAFKPGQSGSPVYLADGSVVAVAKASDRDSPSVGFAVPARLIGAEYWDDAPWTPVPRIGAATGADTVVLTAEVPAVPRQRTERIEFQNAPCGGYVAHARKVAATPGWVIDPDSITMEKRHAVGEVTTSVENRSPQSFEIFADLANVGVCGTLPGSLEAQADTAARYAGLVRYLERPLEGTKEVVTLGRAPLGADFNLPVADPTATNLSLAVESVGRAPVTLDSLPSARAGVLGAVEFRGTDLVRAFEGARP